MAELYESGFYNTGTASIVQGQTVVTGQGTAWLQAVRPADDFGKHVGMPIPIASVDSDTQITLAYPWPGPTQVTAPYRVTFTPYHVAYRQALQEIGELLASGNVSALAGLDLVADKLPYATGPGTMALTGLSPFMRTLLDDTNAAGFWSTIGATAPPDRAFRRGNVLGNVSQSGGVPTGALIERGSNANGEYIRFADGTQICWGLLDLSQNASSNVVATWSFPASFSSSALIATSATLPTSSSNYTGAITPQSVGHLFRGTDLGVSASTSFGFWRVSGSSWQTGDQITNVMLTAIGRWF